MNVPNRLTVSRLVLTPVFLAFLFYPVPYGNTFALVLFSIAGLTDYFDGKIARRDKLVTNFGTLMDPLADKILVCSAFIAFVEHKQIAAWMVVIIVAREFAITGLRLLAASKQVVLAAEGYGKHKTISQIVAVISLLVLTSYPEWGSWTEMAFAWWVPGFAELSKWVAVTMTVTSGVLYMNRNRNLYMSEL
jgi:CDP-diacylglycerol---glycerol-3-phosphate 3-phosphatidyltransferase